MVIKRQRGAITIVLLSGISLYAMERIPVPLIGREGRAQGERTQQERAPVMPSLELISRAKKLQSFLDDVARGSSSFYEGVHSYHGFEAFQRKFDSDRWMLNERGENGKTLILNVAECWWRKRPLGVGLEYASIFGDDWDIHANGFLYRNTEGPLLKRVFDYILERGRGNSAFEANLDELLSYLFHNEKDCQHLIASVNRFFPGRFDYYKREGAQRPQRLLLPRDITDEQLAKIERREERERQEEDRRIEERRNAFLISQLFDLINNVFGDHQIQNVYTLLQDHPWLIHACNEENEQFVNKVCSLGRYKRDVERECFKELFAYLLYHGADPACETLNVTSRHGTNHETVFTMLKSGSYYGINVADFRAILLDFQTSREHLAARYPQLLQPAAGAVPISGAQGEQDAAAQQNQGQQQAQGQTALKADQQRRERPVRFLNSHKGLATIFGSSVVLGMGLAWYIKRYYMSEKEDEKPRRAST